MECTLGVNFTVGERTNKVSMPRWRVCAPSTQVCQHSLNKSSACFLDYKMRETKWRSWLWWRIESLICRRTSFSHTRRAVCSLSYPLCLQPCRQTVITAKEGSYCWRSWCELHSFILWRWFCGIHWKVTSCRHIFVVREMHLPLF